MSMITTC